MKLEISLFRFDKDSDYLPYYTKHFLKIEDEKNLLDILKTLSKEENFSFLDSTDAIFVVNNKYMLASTSLESIIKNCNKDIEIEPISIKRAYKDFLINEDDFYSKFKILESFCDFEDKKFYERQKIFYYASNSLNYNDKYIGDAIILLASKLISEKPEKKENIFKILKNEKFGLNFHTNLENRIFNFDLEVENKIKNIQKELGFIKKFNQKTIDFKVIEENIEIKHNFNNFNIACFNKDNKYEKLLGKFEAKFLVLENFDLDLAKESYFITPDLTHFVASQILLNAFDNGADFLLVFNNEDFFIFNNKLKEIEKLSNREIPLPIIHINEFLNLASSNFEEAKKSFKIHKIKPRII